MDFSLSEEEAQVRSTIRRFVEREVMPLEDELLRREREGAVGLPHDIIEELQAKATDAGYWGLDVPAEYGGAELSAVMQAIIRIEVSRSFVPFRFAGTADNILYEANDEQKERYLLPTLHGKIRSCFALTEPDAGSDATAIRTRARRDGTDWIIDGEKTFITGGMEADFAIVFAVTGEEHGTKGGVTAFLVDREDGWTSTPIPTMGNWAPAALHFESVRVPDAAILGEVGRGFELAMRWIGRGRYMIAARAVGTAERLLDMAIRYSRERHTFGKPIADYQAIQWMLADSAVEIESVKWLGLHAAWLVDQGLDARHFSSIAKLSGATMANAVVDRVLQIHGGMGYTKEFPIERCYRELRVMRIFEGTDEIQRRAIARNLLREHVRVGETPIGRVE